MSNNQATIEDLIDEMYDVLDKGWKMPLSSGKVLVDSEEIRAILDDIRDVFPQEIGQAKAMWQTMGRFWPRPTGRRTLLCARRRNGPSLW